MQCNLITRKTIMKFGYSNHVLSLCASEHPASGYANPVGLPGNGGRAAGGGCR